MSSNTDDKVHEPDVGNRQIVLDDDDDDNHVVDTTTHSNGDDAKGHTFRQRRLTYSKKDLADAFNSPELQALAGLDSDDDNDDANGGKKGDEHNEKQTMNSNSTEAPKVSEPITGITPNKDETLMSGIHSTNTENDKLSENSNTISNENQLEAKVLHASAPPLPKDCMKRRGSLLYVHHDERLEDEQQPLKRSKLLENDNDEFDESSTTSSSDEAEWKKRRVSSIHAKDDSLPFPRHIVGTYSCHGIEPVYDESDHNSDSAPFIAKTNQDRGGIAFPYANNSKMAVFAAYDGHGDGGEHVAQYALHEVPRRLEIHDDFLKGNFEKAFKEVFVEVDKDLAYEDDIEPQYSGCTACVALLNDNVIHFANAGDSRAVMACRTTQNGKIVRQALDLTVDQNPDSPGEQERIEQMGGYVSPPPEDGLSARVWLDCNYSQIGLAMSRSLGDHAVKPIGVIATPVVSIHELKEEDDFMIIATDGVWEFMSSQEAVDIVSKHLDNGSGSSVACQNLIESAAGLWHDNEGDYRDDITALVIKVKELWKD